MTLVMISEQELPLEFFSGFLRGALVVNSAARESQPVTSETDWRRALETLAAAQADARTPAFALLQAEGGAAGRSLELVVVPPVAA